MANEIYTVGEGYDVDDMTDAVNLVPGDLSAQEHQWIQVYYYDADNHATPYAETLDIYTGFFNASATDYIDVQAMVSHGGMQDSGIIIDASNSTTTDIGIKLGVFTKFRNFCVVRPTAYPTGWNFVIYTFDTGHVRIENNVLYNFTSNQFYAVAVGLGGAAQENNLICDNIIVHQSFNSDSVGVWGIRLNSGAAGLTNKVHNNIVLVDNLGSGAAEGIGCGSSAYDYNDISNNYASAKSNAFYLFNSNSNGYLNYNISSDGTADGFGGTGNLVNHAAVDCFEDVTPGSENLIPKQGSILKRKGQDNSSLFTTDILGYTRQDWTCGAFEYFPRRIAGRMRRG